MPVNEYNMGNQQRDIILSPNEFVFVQSNTNGVIKTYTGPSTITISTQDSLVIFNEKTKCFETVQNPNQAKQLMILPPENWYAILKNPAVNNEYPEPGKATISPTLSYGRKINIKGPTSFALFPGQMAKVIRGHALRSNQYLLARVYEAESANNNEGEILDSEGKKITQSQTYVNGQLLVIKGTEVSFYIPPTGIEVIPLDRNSYVREAVTLERLEYCILKDENGNKRYVHGPEVVFPEPTETFVSSSSGGYKFRAIELSKISGIYVKVIAEYEEENTKKIHPVGEELFITGNEQMIYYPRPEHSIISYDGKIVHHAIAIPEGEGRYILNRLTGAINTIKGPVMYLPDPRTEIVVKRKLTPNQCALWYPGNKEVLSYNNKLDERQVEKQAKKATTKGVVNNISFDSAYLTTTAATLNNTITTDSINCLYTEPQTLTLSDIESNASISRGTSYTKPRTITLDNKYDGVVSIDIWTGYAVNVVSKNGRREVVCGPQTILLDYDQTLEVLNLSKGECKTPKETEQTVFLRYENGKITDKVHIVTKDFVEALIDVSYTYTFNPEDKGKWFNVENFVQHVCDYNRYVIRKVAKEYTIEDFYANYGEIISKAICSEENKDFAENGLTITKCEAGNIQVESEVEDLLNAHQEEMIKMSLKLSNANKRIVVAEKLSEAEKKEQELRTEKLLNSLELQRKEAETKLEVESYINRKREEEKKASKNAEKDMQELLDAIQENTLARKRKEEEARLSVLNAEATLEKARQEAYAETVAKIMSSISPELIASMTSEANADILAAVTGSLAPYAMAKGESVAEFTNKLLRGTSLENILENLSKKEVTNVK